MLADTHIGFEYPLWRRIARRRRGDDVLANFKRALEPALCGEVDLVVHGGDVFHRSSPPPALIDLALSPLLNVASAGVPVCVVPGNHERAWVPQNLWSAHPNLHFFYDPQTIEFDVRGHRVALGGFPYCRHVRQQFRSLAAATGLADSTAEHKVLCMHQAFEGAVVGPAGYVFRAGQDVVRADDLPSGLSLVLSGHIHRPQALVQGLGGRPLAAPVLYPGSVERISFAEVGEPKGYAIVDLEPSVQYAFKPLPTRPMVQLEVAPTIEGLERALSAVALDSIVQIRMEAPLPLPVRRWLAPDNLRHRYPAMEISVPALRRS